MNKRYIALAGAGLLTILGIICVNTARAQGSAPSRPSTPIAFVREGAPTASGTPYSATFPGFVLSGRVDLTIGTTKRGGHTFTSMIAGVRSSQGTYRRGSGVSHFDLPSTTVIPPTLLKSRL